MKKLLFLSLFFLSSIYSNSLKAQAEKYVVIQGFSYLHTQVGMFVKHWEKLPLKHKSVADHKEGNIKTHLNVELEYDEKWISYLKEDKTWNHHHFHHFDKKIRNKIDENLKFYQEVTSHVRTPENIKTKIDAWRKKFKEIDENMHLVILPALCK